MTQKQSTADREAKESALRASEHVVDGLARRDELRRLVRATLDKKLDGTDMAVLVASGLLGALPSQLHMPIPDVLHHALSGLGPVLPTSLLRDAVLEGLKDKTIRIDLSAIADRILGDERGCSQFSGQMLVDGLGTGTMAMVPAEIWDWVPDLSDLEESAVTRILTDAWCRHRGWSQADQIYHEAKALAYTVKAIVGVQTNPDPLAFGLSAWHIYKAVRASGQVTRELDELVAVAVADGERVVSDYEAEMHLSKALDSTVERLLRAPAGTSLSERDEADRQFLDALCGTERTSWRLS